jgi:tryptophan synthase beta chain
MPAVTRLVAGVRDILPGAAFQARLREELTSWVGRPTALTRAARLGRRWGADVWLKREDMAHTGAHKINNAIGQALLAQALGATRVVAETGAGQHGVASAAACARVGLPCVVYMGEIDVARQAPNVDRMHRLGERCVPQSTRRFAIGSRIRAERITCSARPSARIRIRCSCGSSKP